MQTKKHPVPDNLAPFIKSYMVKEVNIVQSQVIFPAVSSSYLMFHYGDDYDMRLKNKKDVRFSGVTLSGISTRYSTFVKNDVKVRFIGAQLQAFTPYLLLQDRVADVIDTTLNFEIIDPVSKQLLSTISEIKTNDEAVEALNTYFNKLFASIKPLETDLQNAIDMMSNPKEFESIDSRLKRIDENTRNFRRKFKRIMGLSPKLYMRILRMEKVLEQLYTNPDLDYLTKAYGFYDQSHLIKECKYFTGRTPGKMANTLQNRNQQKYHTNLAK